MVLLEALNPVHEITLKSCEVGAPFSLVQEADVTYRWLG